MPTGSHNYFQTSEDAEKSLWDSQVDKLKKAAQEFTALFSQLEGLKPPASNVALKGDYDALMNRGAFVRSQVENVTRLIDSAVNSIKNLFGVPTINGLAGRLGELGFIPLVPLAVIAGAITVVTGWNAAAMVMRTRLQQAQLDAAKKAGASAEQLTRIIQNQSDSNQDVGFSTSIGNAVGPLIKFAAIGLAIYLFAPVIRDALRGK